MPHIVGLETGKIIKDNVRLVRLLGEGGMGSVWVADHLTLCTQVAVKFIAPELADSPASVARFAREASAAAQVKSPHIVQTYDHGVTQDGLPYIVMELLEGEDLGKTIDRLGALSLAETSVIISQACKALGKAHTLGIVHRDVKPENIFLVANDDDEVFVKVLDFGIAKSSDANPSFSVTTTGVLVGTPYFMSPEQLHNSRRVDLRADLWSLSVVAYLCVTGRVPFDAENFASLCIAIDKGIFAAPSTLRPGTPLGLDLFFRKALARDIDERFSSARELSENFAASTGERLVAAPTSISDHQLTRVVPSDFGETMVDPNGQQPVFRASTLGGAVEADTSRARRRPATWIAVAASVVVALSIAGGLLFSKGKDDAPPVKEPAVLPSASLTTVGANSAPSASASPAESDSSPIVVGGNSTGAAASPIPSATAKSSAASTTKVGKAKPTSPPPGKTAEPDRGF